MFHSQIIAAGDPTPFNKPRFISWPSVCDTTQTHWLDPSAEQQPQSPLPQAETFTIDVGCHIDAHGRLTAASPPLLVSQSPPLLVFVPADQSYTFTAIPAPPPVSLDLYATVLCAPGVPPPGLPKPRSNRADTPANPKKRGRPAVFDEVRRAEFLGMVNSGCTIRYAARRVGVSHATVVKACDRDPLFAQRLARAQQERDILSVRRIQNAGEKSWRAAAWLLERNEPQEFSLQQKHRDPWTVRGQRRLKKFVTDIVNTAIADRVETSNRNPTVNHALQLIEDRLAEIESHGNPYDESDDEQLDDDFDAHGERGGLRRAQSSRVSPPMADDDLDADLDDEPDEHFEQNDGFQSEEAAVESYRQLLRKLNRQRR